jgi:threonine dehydrogenase-like Zn-dependent dehydrogenase
MDQIELIQKRASWDPQLALVLGAGPVGLLAAALLRLRDLDTVVYDRVAGGPKPELVGAIGARYVQAREGLKRDAYAQGERIDIIVEAAGYSPLVFESIDVLGPNGILCVTGVSSGSRRIEIDSDSLNLELVLENKVVFGTVNANRRHFDSAVADLVRIEERWPGWLERLTTRRVPLDRYEEALERREDDVKVLVTVGS